MNERITSKKPPAYEQLESIIRQYQGVDDVLKSDLEGLAAVAWLAHHAYDSSNPGYLEEDYQEYASHAFRFMSEYLIDRANNFIRTKDTVVDLVLNKRDEGNDHA